MITASKRPRVLTAHLSALYPVGELVFVFFRTGSPGVITSIASRFGDVYGEPRVRLSGFRGHFSWLAVALVGETKRRAEQRRDAFGRAGGGAVCDWCGRELRQHPGDPGEPFLTVLCDLRRVKL